MKVSIRDLNHVIRRLPDPDRVPMDHCYIHLPKEIGPVAGPDQSETVPLDPAILFTKQRRCEGARYWNEWTFEIPTEAK